MYGRLSVVTPATAMPVSVDVVRQHTRIDHTFDDNLLAIYLASAVEMAERFLNRTLMPQTLRYSIADSFPVNSWPLVPAPILVLPLAMEWTFSHSLQKDVELPRGPVTAVDSVKYANWRDLSDTALTTDQYLVDLAVEPARVRLGADVPWVSGQHITIDYHAGYANAAAIPSSIIHALLLICANTYEHRGDAEMASDMPDAAKHLMWQHRVYTFR